MQSDAVGGLPFALGVHGCGSDETWGLLEKAMPIVRDSLADGSRKNAMRAFVARGKSEGDAKALVGM